MEGHVDFVAKSLRVVLQFSFFFAGSIAPSTSQVVRKGDRWQVSDESAAGQ